jgi:hypothetical protein
MIPGEYSWCSATLTIPCAYGTAYEMSTSTSGAVAGEEASVFYLSMWETKWSVPWFDSDESMTCRCLNSNPRHFGRFNFIFVSCGESCLLVSWCAGGRCGMSCSDEDHGRSRRPGAEDHAWR